MPIFFNSKGNPEKGVLGPSFCGSKITPPSDDSQSVGGAGQNVIDDDPEAESALDNLIDTSPPSRRSETSNANLTADDLLRSKTFFPDD